jgi:chemotaxis protein histidine kinase CheA
LDALEINTTRESGAVETRFLNFRFNRVVVKGKITHLLVTASDVTRRVKLERELVNSERQVQDQMAMMVYILQADPGQMRDFLEGAVAGLNRINAALKGGSASGVANADIDHFFRIAHRIKGDVAALNLQAIATSLHSFEDLLQGLRNKPQLQNEDLLPVIVRVRTIYAELHAIQEAMARIAQVRGVVNVEPPKPVHDPVRQNSPFVTQWRNLAQQIANRKGKKAELTYQGVDLEKITKSMRETIDTIVTQLIRNAVTHGLETPKERTDQGKVEQGAIAVYLSEAGDGALELSFRDDGAGINVEKLREAAVRIGSLNAEKARVADVRQLTELIFKPGFSTHDTIDEDAGRGVGLDVVRDLVSRLRGRIHIGTAPGKYCHFRVQIPSHLFASSNLATLALQTEAHG